MQATAAQLQHRRSVTGDVGPAAIFHDRSAKRRGSAGAKSYIQPAGETENHADFRPQVLSRGAIVSASAHAFGR